MRIRVEGFSEDVRAVVEALREGRPIHVLDGEYGPYENKHHHIGQVRAYVDAVPPVAEAAGQESGSQGVSTGAGCTA